MRDRILTRKVATGNYLPPWRRPCYCELHGWCSTCRAWRAIARRVLPALRVVGPA